MSKASVQRVITAIQKYYPIALADKSWDNTGLLVEAFDELCKSTTVNVLLTIDLTQSVAEEACAQNANLIMAYHPFIFKGLKSITPNNPQQKSLIKLIQNNISVYCPHTAVDSAKGGVNDFLSDGIVGNFPVLNQEPIIKENQENFPDCGMGRLITLSKPIELSKLIDNVKQSLNLSHLQVGLARNQSLNHKIEKIAICAGSGGSVFNNVKADLYYTGELSHHEALFFTESGSSVIITNHSNSEREFLSVIKKQLEKEVENINVKISTTDKDPFQVY